MSPPDGRWRPPPPGPSPGAAVATVATGTFLLDDCTPDRARRRFIAHPVTVELTGARVGPPAGLQHTTMHLQHLANGVRRTDTLPLTS